MTRDEASRTTANASIMRSSTSSPRSMRWRNSMVLACNAASLKALISGSSALMSGTMAARALTFLPSPARRMRSRRAMRPLTLPALGWCRSSSKCRTRHANGACFSKCGCSMPEGRPRCYDIIDQQHLPHVATCSSEKCGADKSRIA